MNRRILSKSFIFLMTAVIAAGNSYGEAETEQSHSTTVSSAVTIEKLSSNENGYVEDALTGILREPLNCEFLIKANETNYEIVVSSIIKTQDQGDVPAYGQNETILFGHTTQLPMSSAVDDAKLGGNNNVNVIAYPVSCAITNSESMTVTPKGSYGNYGNCYVINVNSVGDGKLTHRIETGPVGRTYDIRQDQAGVYQSTVYVTAIKKQ